MRNEETLPSGVQAVLREILAALQKLADTGETWSIFSNKLPLTQEERQELRDFLGTGDIKITLSGSDEPAEWVESGVSGIWYGVFYDHTGNPMLETIEVTHFPQVPSAQPEDVERGVEKLKNRLG